MKKVLIYPKYSNNPYQYLLYKGFSDNSHLQVKFLIEGTDMIDRYPLKWIFPIKLLINRFQGFSVFHFHWVEFNSPTSNRIELFLNLLYTIMIILFIKLLNYKLIWTIHDIIPHDKLTSNDLLISKFLSIIVNKKIVHSKSVIYELKKSQCNTRNIVVIPHGAYSEYYKNNVSRSAARKYLKLQNDEFIFLFFGELKTYKGIDDLLLAFSKLARENKKITLLIAGRIHDSHLITIINQAKSVLNDKLFVYSNYIDDDKVQYFMNASDIVVYPFKKINTSGSLLLALAYGKPTIYPNIGGLQDLPDTIGIPYDRTKPEELYKSLKYAASMNLSSRSLAALAYSNSLPLWSSIAKELAKIYQQ